MTEVDRLERSYRKLLGAYPRWYRRERGLELLTTLLDNAAPGRRRPQWSEVLDLVGGGAWTRLRPPRSLSARFIVVVVSLSMALVVSGAALLASGYPGPPSEAEATAVASIGMGLPVHDVPGPVVPCNDLVCADPIMDDDVVAFDETPMGTAHTNVYYHIHHARLATTLDQARDRLRAAGWRVVPDAPTPVNGGFVASKDGLDVDLSLSVNTGYVTWFSAQPADTGVTVEVVKHVSTGLMAFVIAAFFAGMFAGWIVGVWATQRFKRHYSLRPYIMIAAVPFLIGASLTIFETFMIVWGDVEDGISPDDIQAPLAFVLFWWPITVGAAVSALCGLAALWLTARPGRVSDVASGVQFPTGPGVAS